MRISYNAKSYNFRSRGLMVFISLLKERYPNRVGLADIEGRLPGIDPKQLARFIDTLEKYQLPLVAYETKTRGPYLLAVSPKLVELVMPLTPTPAHSGPCPEIRAAQIGSSTIAIEALRNPSWVSWCIALLQALSQFHQGNISTSDGALDFLAKADDASLSLPPWANGIVQLRKAQVLARSSEYKNALACLRRVETLSRDGHARCQLDMHARIIKAKIRYDQGRYGEADRILAGANSADAFVSPRRSPMELNMHALLSGRKALAVHDEAARLHFDDALQNLFEALGGVFLDQADSSLLNALTFNIGNLFLRGVKQNIIPRDAADLAMQWFAANDVVCSKLQTGGDSILINLLMFDVGMEYGYHTESWPQDLRNAFQPPPCLVQLLQTSLNLAQKTGNRLEIAQCLRRQIKLAGTSELRGRMAYLEAKALFAELGRHDVIPQLEAEWSQQFGTTPPRGN